jgi:hypothetical protein
MESSQWKIEVISFIVKFYSYHYQFRSVGQSMKQTQSNMWYSLFQAQSYSNIPAVLGYGIYLSIDQSLWFDHDFLDRGLPLTRKLLNSGFLVVKLQSSLRKFYGRHHKLVNIYWVTVSQMTTDMVSLLLLQSCPFLIHDWYASLEIYIITHTRTKPLTTRQVILLGTNKY